MCLHTIYVKVRSLQHGKTNVLLYASDKCGKSLTTLPSFTLLLVRSTVRALCGGTSVSQYPILIVVL